MGLQGHPTRQRPGGQGRRKRQNIISRRSRPAFARQGGRPLPGAQVAQRTSPWSGWLTTPARPAGRTHQWDWSRLGLANGSRPPSGRQTWRRPGFQGLAALRPWQRSWPLRGRPQGRTSVARGAGRAANQPLVKMVHHSSPPGGRTHQWDWSRLGLANGPRPPSGRQSWREHGHQGLAPLRPWQRSLAPPGPWASTSSCCWRRASSRCQRRAPGGCRP